VTVLFHRQVLHDFPPRAADNENYGRAHDLGEHEENCWCAPTIMEWHDRWVVVTKGGE